MKKDCRENCKYFKQHIEADRISVCNHKDGPEIVYPRVEPWACSLWRKRSTNLPDWNPKDKIFCMEYGTNMEISDCEQCKASLCCVSLDLYAKKHETRKK
jgi:hypothetical protein